MTDNSALITTVAKAMLNGVYNRKTAWDEFPEDHLSFERKAAHALEYLASTGRLAPPDDDVIDAEVYGLRTNGDWLLSSSELDDLRIAWEAVKGYRVDGYARPHVNRLVQVVGKLMRQLAEPVDGIGGTVSETAKTWDMGDTDPGKGVTSVATVEIDDEDCRPIHFGRTYSDDEWKGYDRGGKVYLSWAELVRRYGPITEVSS